MLTVTGFSPARIDLYRFVPNALPLDFHTLTFCALGHFEDVKGVADELDKYQKETGIDIPIHVDAASGYVPLAWWESTRGRLRLIASSESVMQRVRCA